MEKQYSVLRLLLAFFLLYMAWPYIQVQGEQVASYFWLGWLVFFLFVVGANLADLLRISRQPALEEERKLKKRQQSV
ncbi:hypothetical protein [Pontibacillus litoralis]|uniref:Uncharacterized protein n=1 Tax=Pontibacillus litoralis JSM 072002 TaxID=1385512 RepID=A0A0A5GAS2_9BACI|nr:hypothetical protein [Pontibacillus litoralis]KGX89109.1 hypothetical protein N784_01920 [Pontibacillus litoralis JSM 072002]